MFEKCGIYDVFSAIWKFKWLIAAVVVLAAVAGFGLGVLGGDGAAAPAENDSLWVASASFSVTHTGEVSGNSTETTLARDQQKAYGILAVANADYKRAQIFETLSQKYTAEQIVNGLDLNIPVDELSFYSFVEVVNGSVPAGSSILHIFLTGKDQQIVSDYMEAQKKIIEETAAEIGDCEVRFIDGVVGQKTAEDESGLVAKVSPVSQGILFAIVGFVLAVLAVAVKAIFWPTVNRRSDFAAYGLSVLGEVRIRK